MPASRAHDDQFSNVYFPDGYRVELIERG